MNQDDLLQYLLSRGVPHAHALGMLANVQGESSFNPAAIGDNGTSGGLFQHHGDRFEKLKQFAASRGTPWTDWQTQVDYALSEPDTQTYLAKSFASPQDASVDFTVNWERPANAKERARQRLAFFNDGGQGGHTVPMSQVAGGPAYQGQAIEPVLRGNAPMNPYMQPPPFGVVPGMQQPQPPDLASGIMSDPWVQMGAGILANPQGALGHPMTGIAQGLQQAQEQRLDRLRADQFAKQNALVEAKMYGMETPSLYQQATSRGQPQLFKRANGDFVTAYFDKMSGQWVDASTGQPTAIGPGDQPWESEGSKARQEMWVVPTPSGPVTTTDPDEARNLANQYGVEPHKAGTGAGKSGKQTGIQADAAQVLRNIDSTIADIKANPWTQGMLAPLRSFGGRFLGSIADDLSGLGAPESVVRKFRDAAKGTGVEEIASIDFRLASSVSDAAKYIINKGDPRMSQTDVDRADELMKSANTFKNSEAMAAVLMELRNVIAYYDQLPPDQMPQPRGSRAPTQQGTPPPLGAAVPQGGGQGGWTPEDEQRLQELERKSKAAASEKIPARWGGTGE